MSFSDADRSGASSPIPWKEMFQSASNPLPLSIPPSLSSTRSSPALRYLSKSEPASPSPKKDSRKHPQQPHDAKPPRAKLSSFLSNGKVSFDPSTSTLPATKLEEHANSITSAPDATPQKPSDQSSTSASPNQLSQDPGSFNQQHFQLAVYIAMAHGVLIFLVMVLYGTWKLLECYRKPIQWAVLCSMPLRAIHGTIVNFWERSLNQGLIATVLAIPFAVCRALIGTTMDAHLAFLQVFRIARSKDGRTVGFSTLMEWLVSFGVMTMGYERLGISSFIFIPLAVMTLYFVGISLGLMPVIEDVNLQTKRSLLSAEPSRRWKRARSWLEWLFAPITELGMRLSRLIVDNLHHMVAVFLIIMMIAGSLSGLILFSYKIGLEGKGVVVALQTHVQKSNYVEKVGLKQWIEDNKVPELIDTYTSKAYDTLSSQIDVLAAKYQMTDLADAGKQYVIGLAQRQRKGNMANSSGISNQTAPSHPVLGKVLNITNRMWEYDMRGLYLEIQDVSVILLEHFNVSKEELFDKAKQAGERWLDVGKHVFGNSSRLFSGLMHLLLSTASSILSGAPEIINFCANAFVFFSVLHYLIASKSGGVMEQVLGMLPLSESTRTRCAVVLDNAVSSVLLATVKAAFFQASFTWLLFHTLKIHFLYMSTLLAFFSALLPLIPTWWSSLPAGAQLAIEGHYIQAILLMAAHMGLMDFGVSAIQSGIPGHNAYMTGLSIAGGMALFPSAIEGAIMGPLLMTVAISLKNLYSEFVLTTAKNRF